MKAWLKTSVSVLIGVVAVGLLASAQLTSSSAPASLSAAPPDSIVQVTAEAQGLEPVASADLPSGGTFWLVTSNGITAPSPCPPGNLSDFPVYAMADGIFLVDETGGQVMTNEENSTIESALAAQADAVTGLINQIQDAQLNQDMALAFGLDLEMDSSSSFAPMFAVSDPTALWLEITNVSNGWSYFNLHNGTNFVYAILSTTSLSGGTWNVETELFPTLDQTNIMPFAVQNSGRDILFLKAMDWTGVTENGNTVPDWWLWEYYGTTALSDTNLDANGNQLVTDYQNGTDPNIISFTLAVANNYVNSMSAPVQLDIASGSPFYYAVSVDDTNYQADANWQAYAGTNLTVNLGITEGWHDVWIGLKGLPASATQTWQYKRLNLKFTSPALVLTSPTSPTVKVPLLQLTGYSPVPLDSLSYDLNNALGLVTNQDAGVTSQYYDKTIWDFTTNYFEALDIPLTNGVNTITIHATDLAGNVATLVTNFTLDYSSATNPAVQLTWPTNGMELCGDSFTLRGTVDDPTATVVASITDTNGNTTTISGVVERNGVLWAENLPLAEGTNYLTLSVTNSAGLPSATNIAVVKSGMTLALTSIDGNLWSPTVNVGGVISDPAYCVWVNGVRGTNSGHGTWSAANVPVSAGGVASFDVSAVNGGDPAINTNVDKPARLYTESYAEADGTASGETNTPTGCVWTYNFRGSSSCLWSNDFGGIGSLAYDIYFGNVDCNGGYDHPWGTNSMFSPASPWESLASGLDYETSGIDYNAFGYSGNGTNYYISGWTPPVAWEHCHVQLPVNLTAGGVYQWEGSWYGVNANTRGEYHRTADAVLKLQTGGKALSHRQNLFRLAASAAEMTDKHAYYIAGYGFYYDDVYHPTKPISSQNITIGNKPVGSDGNLWRAYADNDTRDVTPRVKNLDFYYFNVTQQKYELRIIVNGSNPLWPEHVAAYNKYCVGQYLGFDQEFTPALPETPQYSPAQWALDGTYVNTNIPAQFSDGSSIYTNDPTLLKGLSTHAWWYDGEYDPTTNLKATLGEGLTFANGQYVLVVTHGLFTMHRPQYGYITNIIGIGEYLTHPHYLGYQPSSDMDSLHVLNCSYSINIQSHKGGQAFITQTFDGSLGSSGDGGFDTHGADCLDNTEVYGVVFNETNRQISVVPDASTNNLSFGDNPRVWCNGHSWHHSHFKDYIRFQPDGGIPVTIGVVTWHNDGDTDLTPINPPNPTPQDYAPFYSATNQVDQDGNRIIPTGDASWDNFTTDNDFTHWVHTYINQETN